MEKIVSETFGIERLSVRQLDDIGRHYSSEVGTLDGTDETRVIGQVGQLAGGWEGRWINTSGLTNQGTLVLIAKSPQAKGIRKEAITRCWSHLGLGDSLAAKLYDLRVEHAHFLVPFIVDCIGNEASIIALKALPGRSKNNWLASYGQCIPDSVASLNMPRLFSLLNAVETLGF